MIPVLGPITEQTGDHVAPAGRASKRTGKVLLMFQMSSSQQVTVSVIFKDKKNNPAQIDGTPEWLTDNPDVLALTPGTDGKSCLVAAVGPLGTGKVTLTADADLGAGVEQIIGTFDVEVTAGKAKVVTINPGTAVEQPEVPA